MQLNKSIITLTLNNEQKAIITLIPESIYPKALSEILPAEAHENGEACVQILEGFSYEYEVKGDFSLNKIDGIVTPSKLKKSIGRITPNIYVGTLTIDILQESNGEKCGQLQLEVQSIKADYRTDYRLMLEQITEKCVDLILQQNSPVSQYFAVDFNNDAQTLYQRFAFIKSILDSEEFNNAIHKILASPVTGWIESETERNISNVSKLRSSALRQIATASNRVSLSINHSLNDKFCSLPSKIRLTHKEETINTPENRFVKYALKYFLSFCSDFVSKLNKDSKHKQEALLIEEKLEHYLNHSIFREISVLNTLPSNNTVLQRKEGYREVFRVWLMFDLAAKLFWKGGDDIYQGGKRDVAVLYEYWIFFKLLDIVKEVFQIEPENINNLIEETKDGLGLKLKLGKHLPVKGIYDNPVRKLNIEFSYNRTFSGNKEYPNGGSWTRNLRPDYTLSIWPFGINAEQAEREELIVHIHFDAKYRIENSMSLFGEDEDLGSEKEEQNKGSYKRADLLKMHTYKDAIRRTGGAYIIYPGTESNRKFGFHELLPGIGAFAIKPSVTETGINEIKGFLQDVTGHFLNRASQREKISLKTYEVYKDKTSNELKEALPEVYGNNRTSIPDETFIIVGFYKNDQHLKWIISNSLYNARTGIDRGSFRISANEISAKYLLLHTHGSTKTSKIFQLKERGARIFSKEDLIQKKYPSAPTQDFYLSFDIDLEVDATLKEYIWDVSKLKGYSLRRGSGLPFSVSLTELMSAVVR